ncbi:hypothetical protein [Tautonia sociabilis]|uniref:hypothetical protein n=1 Tax=Tautonia sociabilis TaxID=2080755 RepID=UPI0013153E8B|nr:hypothetical protein [Tautonia sociabilis]
MSTRLLDHAFGLRGDQDVRTVDEAVKRQANGVRDQEFFKRRILAIHEATYALVG